MASSLSGRPEFPTFLTPTATCPICVSVVRAAASETPAHKAASDTANAPHRSYAGSLTTPPRSEGITWTVLKEPVEASSEQIRRFAALFSSNARPTQSVDRRFLLESF